MFCSNEICNRSIHSRRMYHQILQWIVMHIGLAKHNLNSILTSTGGSELTGIYPILVIVQINRDNVFGGIFGRTV